MEWNEENWNEYRQLHINSGLADLNGGSYLPWESIKSKFSKSWEIYLKNRIEFSYQNETTKQEIKLLKTFLNNKKIEKLLYEDN